MKLLAKSLRLLRRVPILGRAIPGHWRQFRLRHLLWGALALYLGWNLWIFTYIVSLNWINPDMTSFMSEQLERLQDDDPDAELRYQWVPYAQISRHMKRAILVAEDAKFAEHAGFDWAGMQYAWSKNLKKGRIVAGGSTISQQLAKNLFLSSSRSWLRKGQEAVITLMIETTWDKRRILEVYLNVAEWGNGVFGAEAAARRYYGRPAASLGPGEAARLAVMLPNPRYYERNYGPRLAAHAARVQRRMIHSQVP